MVFMDYQALYDEWLTSPCFDEATKAELRGISEEEKKDRFYTELEFGTAGLRGVIGAGLNRMNIYTVRKATQGLANYIIKAGEQKKGVAIAYDSRHMSPEFADVAARSSFAASSLSPLSTAVLTFFTAVLTADLTVKLDGISISTGCEKPALIPILLPVILNL